MLALTINGATEILDESQQLTAMQRYWKARQAGDPSARLAKLEVVPPPDDPEPQPPPTAAGALSPVAEDRIRVQETWLVRSGFAVPPPIFAPGTRVRAVGDQNFRIERDRVDRMPDFDVAAQAVQDTIADEERRDLTVRVADVRMTDGGELKVGDVELELEVNAFHQLANLCDFGMGARYLAEKCSSGLRATNVNYHLARRDGRQLTLRTRQDGGRRRVFATVTPSYTPVDTDAVLGAVRSSLSDAHVEMRYDGSGVRATALWMPDEVVDLAAGDIFKVGVRIETDDTGRGRIRVSGVVWRNRCLNLIIIGEGEVETVSQVHRGDPDRILEVVTNGVEEARAKVGDFLDAWGHARNVKVQPTELLRSWVESRKLVVPGVRTPEQRDAVVESLLSAWGGAPVGDSDNP